MHLQSRSERHSHFKSNPKSIAMGFLLVAQGLFAADFTKPEWDNPAQAGSSVWIRNAGPAPVRVEALFVRDNGIHKYGEIAMQAGAAKAYYKVTKSAHGRWARLIPVDAKPKLRIRAGDSLLVQEFEYGHRLLGKKNKKVLADQYVLELKVIDSAGDSSVVKISQTADSYYIGINTIWAESAPAED